MPNLKHHIYLDFSISSNYYRGEESLLAEKAQENKFSRNLCCNTSYLIIKEIQRHQIGFKIKSDFSKEMVEKVAVAHADGNNFIAN